MGSRSRKICSLSHSSSKPRWQAALPMDGTCPLLCHKARAAPSSPERVPAAGRERRAGEKPALLEPSPASTEPAISFSAVQQVG